MDFVADGVIVVHSDAGSQYTSLAFTEKLLDLGLAGSVGRTGTAYDNALMESIIGLYKTELVHRRATGWDSREELEFATARWVAWFNRDRLHEMLGFFTPIEIEAAYVHRQGLPRQAAREQNLYKNQDGSGLSESRSLQRKESNSRERYVRMGQTDFHGSAPPKALKESVLRRLTNGAITTFLGQAARYESAGRPGLQMALTNEPVADMNMVVVGAGASEEAFREMARSCLDRELPFLVMIFPESGDRFDDIAIELGLAYAVDFPLMVRDDLGLEPSGNPEVEVVRASSAEDADGSADVLASAYSMPKESVLRALPASLLESPGADVYVARLNGEAVGSVTLTYHGDTCGIWSMGTATARQGGGVGRRLLSTAMTVARRGGVRRFFLGSTPAGSRLYESLDFKTVCSARVYVSGVTHQS